MLTSVECLAKADELDVLAMRCFTEQARDAYTETARGWRATAVLARQQEVFEEVHPTEG